MNKLLRTLSPRQHITKQTSFPTPPTLQKATALIACGSNENSEHYIQLTHSVTIERLQLKELKNSEEHQLDSLL